MSKPTNNPMINGSAFNGGRPILFKHLATVMNLPVEEVRNSMLSLECAGFIVILEISDEWMRAQKVFNRIPPEDAL